jgi:hypothetical protein
MRAGASIPDTPSPPPQPLQLLNGFFVITNGFPNNGTVFPFQVICIDARPRPELRQNEPYASIIVDGGRHPEMRNIELTYNQYRTNFLPAVNPAVNSGRPHNLMLEDREVDGLWFTGTYDEVVRRAQAYIDDRHREEGSGADAGGQRHKRSGKKRKSHKKRKSQKKRSGKKRGHKKSRRH